MSATMAQRLGMRATEEQFSTLLDLMEIHPNLATGKLDPGCTKEDRLKMWSEVAKELNSIEPFRSAYKSPEKWRKTWNGWKWNVRTKALTLKKKNPRCKLEEFSSLEQRLLKLVGLRDRANPKEFKEDELSVREVSLAQFLEDDNAVLVTLLDDAEQNASDMHSISSEVPVSVASPSIPSGDSPFNHTDENDLPDTEETTVFPEGNHRHQFTYEQMASSFADSKNKKLATLERIANAYERKATAEERKATAEERKAVAEERKAAAEERKAAALQDIAAMLISHPFSL